MARTKNSIERAAAPNPNRLLLIEPSASGLLTTLPSGLRSSVPSAANTGLRPDSEQWKCQRAAASRALSGTRCGTWAFAHFGNNVLRQARRASDLGINSGHHPASPARSCWPSCSYPWADVERLEHQLDRLPSLSLDGCAVRPLLVHRKPRNIRINVDERIPAFSDFLKLSVRACSLD